MTLTSFWLVCGVVVLVCAAWNTWTFAHAHPRLKGLAAAMMVGGYLVGVALVVLGLLYW